MDETPQSKNGGSPDETPAFDADRTADATQPENAASPHSRPNASSSRPETGSSTRTANRTNTRFASGDLIANRYRVVAFLGKGGMGEVYRADDLELAQSVAIKILPARVSADPTLAERVRAEVRLARGITHANVCRIHDIAKLPAISDHDPGGDLFITMEYVDGEDLATLLRRIGKLPQDKAVDIARQLCAALAAAHEQGVIHRDLKPANVMLDGRGNARLTDFGIAALDQDIDARDASSGTPAYMSPEQFSGDGVSRQSDIYALGLVILELLTGEPAWKASSLAELRTLRESTGTPSALTSISQFNIDPALAAVIERCTETDPADRPASALAVAAALPGADPLAAAIAAGETPSPELIAASGGRGVLRPAIAAALAITTVLFASLALPLSNPTALLNKTGSLPEPAVLQDAAMETIRALGHDIDPSTPSHGAWLIDGAAVRRVRNAIAEENGEWDQLNTYRDTPIRYWLRFEPGGFEPRTPDNRVWLDYPARDAPGSMVITLDTQRRLRNFTRIPGPFSDQAEQSEPDWTIAFQLAGLDYSRFTPIDRRANPGNDPAVRRAWTGPAPQTATDGKNLNASDTEPHQINVFLAATNGLITDVTLSTAAQEPKTKEPEIKESDTLDQNETNQREPKQTEPPDNNEPGQQTPAPPAEPDPSTVNADHQRIANLIQTAARSLIIGTITIGAALLAYRNIRQKRGDLRRATSLGITLFCLGAASSILEADIAPVSISRLLGPYPTWSAAIGFTLITAACYIAAEPLARTRLPGSLVSWTRLFSGQVRDPMVGREILIGLACGSTLFCILSLNAHIAPLTGEPPKGPGPNMFSLLVTLKGVPQTLGAALGEVGNGLLSAAAVTLLICLVMIPLSFLRITQKWPAIVIVALLIILQQASQIQLSLTDRAFAALANVLAILVIARVGLLAGATCFTTMSLLTITAASLPLDAWWAPAACTPLALLAALLLYSYRTATAGRSIFG